MWQNFYLGYLLQPNLSLAREYFIPIYIKKSYQCHIMINNVTGSNKRLLEFEMMQNEAFAEGATVCYFVLAPIQNWLPFTLGQPLVSSPVI